MVKLSDIGKGAYCLGVFLGFPLVGAMFVMNLYNFSGANYKALNEKLEAMYADKDKNGIITQQEKNDFLKNFNRYLSQKGIIMNGNRLGARFTENGSDVPLGYIEDLALGHKTNGLRKLLNDNHGSDGTGKYEPKKIY